MSGSYRGKGRRILRHDRRPWSGAAPVATTPGVDTLFGPAPRTTPTETSMSESTPETALQHSPLHARHLQAGARMVPFAGWAMPVRYESEIDEHHAVRKAAGLFDVSHMGEIRISGLGAEAFLQRTTPNHVARLKPGRAHYSGLLTEAGTYVDDLLIYRLDDEDFLVVVNAANREADLEHLLSRPHPETTISDESDRWALLALQGPKAPAILARHTDVDLDSIKYYRFVEGEVDGLPGIVSRTGYTGEDGFELYLPPEEAPRVWQTLLASGEEDGLIPCGLASRDTLRLEAGLALYGHEIDRTITPYEANLGWVVKLKKGEFVGRDVLARQKEEGVERRLVGFEVLDRGIAREGHEVSLGAEAVDVVRSGSWSPTLEKAIGTTFLPPEHAEAGTEIEIAVRRRKLRARVVDLPFYRRS